MSYLLTITDCNDFQSWITGKDGSRDFRMSEISASTLSILTKFSWLFSVPKTNAAITLFRTRLPNRRTCGHVQKDNLFSLFCQSTKAEVQISSQINPLLLLFSILSDDRSKASSKTIPPHSAIQSLIFQMRVSSPVLKVIQ